MYKFALNSYTWAIHLEFEPDLTRYHKKVDSSVKMEISETTYTNTVKQNPHLVCLWSKMSSFQANFLPPKIAGLPLTTSIFNTICESFQMKFCVTFCLKVHQNYKKSKLKIPKKSSFIK